MRSKKPTAGIVLAAGRSHRFGSPKQLLRWGEQSLLEVVVTAALNSQLERVVLVLGCRYEAVLGVIADKTIESRLDVIENTLYRNGLSGSIHAGLKVVQHKYPSVMFLLADQPLVTAAMIDLILSRYWGSNKEICVPVSGGRRGNPTIFSQRFYQQLLQAEGDIGGREIIRNSSDHLLEVQLDDASCLMDIDMPADLEKFNPPK